MLGVQLIGSQTVRQLEWADDDHLLIVTSRTGLPIGF
jgi:hypothetical protein